MLKQRIDTLLNRIGIIPKMRGHGPLRVQIEHQHTLALLSQQPPKVTAVVVLPTPPFWLATVQILKTSPHSQTLSVYLSATRCRL